MSKDNSYVWENALPHDIVVPVVALWETWDGLTVFVLKNVSRKHFEFQVEVFTYPKSDQACPSKSNSDQRADITRMSVSYLPLSSGKRWLLLRNCTDDWTRGFLQSVQLSTRLSRARMVTEGCCSQLKGRWRVLLRKCKSSKEEVKTATLAYRILHNVCIDRGETLSKKLVVS